MVGPETRYALSGDVHIAYQTVGDHQVDLLWLPSGGHHIEINWEREPTARWLRMLASSYRLILFDKRGTGMSDRVTGETLEARMDDIRAVLDAAGSTHTVVAALGEAAPLCVLFAATYPERVRALVLVHPVPRHTRSPELPSLPTQAERQRLLDDLARRWGEPGLQAEMFRLRSPNASDEEAEAFGRVFRLSMSPGAFAAYNRMNLDVDVTQLLPAVRVPTLLLRRRDLTFPDLTICRWMAARIPSARLVHLEGSDFAPPIGDPDAMLAEIGRFLDGITDDLEPQTGERVLATLLFTDIVGATARASELGDRAWRELLQRHHETVRELLARHRGIEIDTAGDGFFAMFDGPARAIRCAQAIIAAVRQLGLEIRAGLHTGECEQLDGKIGGIAVHIAARVAAHAQPGEALVSSTVKDLVAGSGIRFSERGTVPLKGVPGEWQLFSPEPDPNE